MHAFFRRGAAAFTGSHVGTGRALSSGVSSDSASITGVEGDDVIAQRACFLAGSVFRFSFIKGTEFADRFIRESEVLGACAGFCAMRCPLSAMDDRTLNPARVSSERRVRVEELKLSKWRVPSGVMVDKSWAKNQGNFGFKEA